MEIEILLALLLKKFEDKLAALPDNHPTRGPRGQKGSPGKDFDINEHIETLRGYARDFALTFDKLSDEEKEQLRGPQGRAGRDGANGKDFKVEDHLDLFNELAFKHRLTFDQFSDADKEELRGPQGKSGRDGANGKDFDVEEHRQLFENLAAQFALKFDDLVEEQIAQIRGPQGKAGRDGRGFIFDEHKEEIQSQLKDLVVWYADNLKLRYADLTDENKEELRGPRGRDGKDGKSFNFDEHKEYFDSLKLKFSDLSAEERDSLLLKYSHLTDAERAELRLRFEDLTPEQKAELKGHKGSRGQKGRDGDDGKSAFELAVEDGFSGSHKEWLASLKGKDGKDGKTIRGPVGISGVAGKNGRDGEDGKDAPYITDIRVEKTKDDIEFVFEFSDGSVIKTNSVTLPRSNVYISAGGGCAQSSNNGGGGSSDFEYLFGAGTPGAGLGVNGNVYQDTTNGDIYKKITGAWVLQDNITGPQGADGDSAYQVAVNNGFVGTEADWLISLIGATGADGRSAYEVAVDNGFVGTEAQWLASLQGADGADGSQIYTGSGAPDDGLGVDGDIYIDEDTGDLYKKVGGTWGSPVMNITGPQGPAGTNGNHFYEPGVPDNGDGNDGDIYVDTTNGYEYKKEAGVWVLKYTPFSLGVVVNLFDQPCDASVYIGSAVRISKTNEVEAVMADWTTLQAVTVINYTYFDPVAVNALADVYENSNVIGIVFAKPTATTCHIQTLGETADLYLGLDVEKEYYLSDTVPGALVTENEVPTATNTVIVRIGQPTTDSRLLYNRGERIVRA